MNRPHHHSKIQPGDKKGLLTILSYEGSKWNGTHTSCKSYWRCRCACGTELIVPSNKFRNDRKSTTQTPASCGCASFVSMGKKYTTHGMSNHPAYNAWRMAKQRCTLHTSQAWADYGGRGIQMCDAWLKSFENFWTDMGPTYREGLAIDRINNDGNYEPFNCRWVTPKTNCRNRRNSVCIETPHGTMNLSEASEYSGINATTLHYRLKNDWPAAHMFDPPKFNNNR